MNGYRYLPSDARILACIHQVNNKICSATCRQLTIHVQKDGAVLPPVRTILWLACRARSGQARTFAGIAQEGRDMSVGTARNALHWMSSTQLGVAARCVRQSSPSWTEALQSSAVGDPNRVNEVLKTVRVHYNIYYTTVQLFIGSLKNLQTITGTSQKMRSIQEHLN